MSDQPIEMQRELLRMTVFLLAAAMLVNAGVLFGWYDKHVPEILVGRTLGWFEASATMALGYWFTTSHSSAIKNGLVSKVAEGAKK